MCCFSKKTKAKPHYDTHLTTNCTRTLTLIKINFALTCKNNLLLY